MPCELVDAARLSMQGHVGPAGVDGPQRIADLAADQRAIDGVA
jgi:hypothetical protein